jgi:hypothetical protein
MDQELIAFSYEQLGDAASKAQRAAASIRHLRHQAQSQVLEIGELLLKIRGLIEPGQFDAWIKAEFEWSRTSAYRFIQVYERFKSVPNIGTIDASALYLIAQDNTPKEAVAEIVEAAQHGEIVSHSKAKEVVTKHKPPAPSREKHVEMERSRKVAVINDSITEIGKLLLATSKKLTAQQYEQWLRLEFGWDLRFANKVIKASRKRKGTALETLVEV